MDDTQHTDKLSPARKKTGGRGSKAVDGRRRTPDNITPQQTAAIEHYLAHGHQALAYRHAYGCEGWTAAAVRSNACRLFRLPHIQAALKRLRAEHASPMMLERSEALVILSQIARGQISNYLDDEGRVDPKALKALGGPEVEALEQETARGRQKALLRLRDPIRAIDRIARLEGWDEPERHGVGQVTITIDTRSGGGESTIYAKSLDGAPVNPTERAQRLDQAQDVIDLPPNRLPAPEVDEVDPSGPGPCDRLGPFEEPLPAGPMGAGARGPIGDRELWAGME